VSEHTKKWHISVVRTISDEFTGGVFTRSECVVCCEEDIRFIVLGSTPDDAKKGATHIISLLTQGERA
jgi:hypothetical protein